MRANAFTSLPLSTTATFMGWAISSATLDSRSWRSCWHSDTDLRPASARCGCLGCQDPPRSFLVGHGLGATPLPGHHEQRSPIGPAERAGKASAVELDRLEYLTTFAHPRATLVGYVGEPDRPLGVHADPVGRGVAEVGPDPTVRKPPVRGDVEGAQSPRPGLGHDQ